MKRSRGGFSLTELLTVVAILAVLMAVAIPAVIAISRNLKMRELDDTAREIFQIPADRGRTMPSSLL